MTLQELYRKQKEIESRLVKLDIIGFLVCLPLIVEMFWFSKGDYVPMTLMPCLIGFWCVVFPLECMARGELTETKKELSEVLKSISSVREKMKAHWK